MRNILMTASVLALVSAGAFAGDKPGAVSAQSDWTAGLATTREGDTLRTSLQRGQFSAREILDAEINGADAEQLAPVEDLMLTGDGKVLAVIVSEGGFLGIGKDNVAIEKPQVTFGIDAEGDVFGSTAMTEQQLELIGDNRYQSTIAFKTDGDSDAMTVEADLLGKTVTSLNGDRIGVIKDAIVARDGTISHLIVSRGDVLGVGGDLVAVDYDRLALEQGDGGDYTTTLTAEAYRTAPSFDYAVPPAARD